MATERQTASGGTGTPDQGVQRTSNFIKETVIELQKTIWPTPQEAWRLTLVVLAVIIALGIYMGLLDYGFTALVSKFNLIK